MAVHHNVDRRGKHSNKHMSIPTGLQGNRDVIPDGAKLSLRSSHQRGDVRTRAASTFTEDEDVRDIDEEAGSSTFEDGAEVASLAPAYSDAGTMPTVEEDGVLPRPERWPLPAFDPSEEDRRPMRSASTPSRAFRSSSEQRELAEEGGDRGHYPRTFDAMSAESGMRGGYLGGARGMLEDQPPVKGRTGRFASFVSNLDVSASGKANIFSSLLRKANASNGGDEHTGPVSLGARGMLTEADEAMLSDSEADYDAFDSSSERADKRLFSPNFWVRRIYPIYMLLMLFVFVFYMPYRVAFHPRESGAFSMVDLMWNVVFFVDILINLNTGFVNLDTGKVVYDRRAIFYRYLLGWFVVDALAAFPFTFLPGLGPEDNAGNHEIAQLLSAPKILRLYGLLAFAQENYQWHEGGFLAVRTLLSVIITAHVFGCGWYMLSTLMHTECEDLFFGDVEEVVIDGIVFSSDDYVQAECPWTYRSGYVQNSIGRQYLSSVYWALTTLTTVGYGDISARTADEQVYSMAVQIVGVSWYGYIVGTWASVLNSFDSEEKEMRSKMREVVAFSKAAGLPHDIAKKVRQHFRFALYRKDNWITFNEHEMLADMPAALRAEVVLHVQRHTINQVYWLDRKDPSFIADIVVNLKPCLFRHGDEIFREGSPSEEIFFVTTGKVIVKYKHSRVAKLKAGNMVGLIGLFSRTMHKVSAIAAASGEEKNIKCFKLSQSDFFELVDRYPNIMEDLLRRTKNRLERISAASPGAKADFMSNEFLADLIEGPHLSLDDDSYGQGQDGRVQLSIGRQDDRDSVHSAAGRWPPGFEPITRAALAALRNDNSDGAKSSGNVQDEGEDDDEDEGEGEGEGEGESSNEDLVSSNGIRRVGTDTAMSGPPTTVNYDSAHALGSNHGSLTTFMGLEDAVSRELALRIPSIEATFVSALERVMNERWKDGPPAISSLAVEGTGEKVTAPNDGERGMHEEKRGNVGD